MRVPQQRVAFVFYPHAGVRLDSMPFAVHIIKRLALSGWHVDVFLWTRFDEGNSKLPENVHYKYVGMKTSPASLQIAELTLRFMGHTRYRCVFSVGQIGSYIGAIISAASRCPYVLLNDEFPSFWSHSRWTYLERWGASRADVIVVPSEDRCDTLREELQIEATRPFVTIRNSPELNLPIIHRNWHKVMGIPRGKKIFVHAGFLGDWTQVPEILASVSYWPDDAILLLHSRSQDEAVRYRRQVSHLENPERVFWSLEPLSEDLLNSLVSYCDGCFALYRGHPNNELMGTSSGKLMRSIVCGTPVLVSSFKSLEFVTREGLGIQIRHPSEIPIAVCNLMRNRETYRAHCTRYAASESSLREIGWAKLVESVAEAPRGIVLTNPR
jgi:glycosyltransferase involved in cell wall biosynthesis